MLYQFQAKDRAYYAFLESQDISFDVFFQHHKPTVETSFSSLLEKMKKEENEKNRQFIAEMDFEQFAIAAQFTFSVIFAKDFFRTLSDRNPVIATLSARVLAQKMNHNPQEYITQLEKVLSCLSDYIYTSFKDF